MKISETNSLKKETRKEKTKTSGKLTSCYDIGMFGIGLPDVPEIDAKKVFEDIKEGKDIVILDVRTPQEFSRGFIKGNINIPLLEMADQVEKIIPDKNKSIYVYCLSGSRSAVAVDLMLKAGYKNVFNMKSGLLAWRSNQFPLEINNS